MNQVRAEELQNRLKPFLIPFSFLYGAFVNVKEGYALKRRKVSFDGMKIVSVGNIVAGGVGKTPLVIEISKALKEHGRVCVVTNIYPVKDKRVHLVSIDGSIFKKPPKIPDEAYMIAKKVPVTVISSKSRVAALELAKGLKIKFVILDDALHVSNINKDLEICVFDAEKSLDEELYLPAGMIRNSKRLLKYCDFKVCVNKNPNYSHVLNSQCDMHTELIPTGIFNSKGNKNTDLKHVSAFVFCGIGNPEGFIKTVKSVGVEIKGFKFFNDHHIYTMEDMKWLEKEKIRTKADILLTTFKDFVKIENYDVWYLDVNLKVNEINKIVRKVVE